MGAGKRNLANCRTALAALIFIAAAGVSPAAAQTAPTLTKTEKLPQTFERETFWKLYSPDGVEIAPPVCPEDFRCLTDPVIGPVSERIVFERDGAAWIRLRFDNARFDKDGGASVTIRAQDADIVTTYSMETLVRRAGLTPAFPVGALEVIIDVPDGSIGDFARPTHIITPAGSAGPTGLHDGEGGERDQKAARDQKACHNDRRQPSRHPAVGRVYPEGCSAFLIAENTLITAGHCDVNDMIVEFNVPASTSSGMPVLANSRRDQYLVTGVCNDCRRADPPRRNDPHPDAGDDWQVFAVDDNDLGKSPGEQQGAKFELALVAPADAVLRVVGFGMDGSPVTRNLTQQEHKNGHPGLYENDPNDVVLFHLADTAPGSSGSPIFYVDDTDVERAVGVHNGGDCDPTPQSANLGTSFRNVGFWKQISIAVGAETFSDAQALSRP